jgi:hypothetical protein
MLALKLSRCFYGGGGLLLSVVFALSRKLPLLFESIQLRIRDLLSRDLLRSPGDVPVDLRPKL